MTRDRLALAPLPTTGGGRSGRRATGLNDPPSDGLAEGTQLHPHQARHVSLRFVWGFGIDATLEDAVTRELVDTIDPAIQEAASHYQCATDPQGLMMWRKA